MLKSNFEQYIAWAISILIFQLSKLRNRLICIPGWWECCWWWLSCNSFKFNTFNEPIRPRDDRSPISIVHWWTVSACWCWRIGPKVDCSSFQWNCMTIQKEILRTIIWKESNPLNRTWEIELKSQIKDITVFFGCHDSSKLCSNSEFI